MQFYLLIITAVCLWTGYGEKVIIQSEVCDESKRFIYTINSTYLGKTVNSETSDNRKTVNNMNIVNKKPYHNI